MSSTDPLILFYTRFFDKPVDVSALNDAFPGRWTTDRLRLPDAAAVVFHIPNFREVGDARKYPGQCWVAWSLESRQSYPLLADPAFMKHFDLTMTHERQADVWAPYVPRAQAWVEMAAAPVLPKTEPAPVALFQSAAVNHSGRADFVAELSRHLGIDSYGRHFNNRKVTAPDRGRATKLETIARHNFCLALENSIEADYVTEKIFDAFAAGTVPIYLGAPNVAEFVPEHSYIDARAFPNVRDLASYLTYLMHTPHAYAAYHSWRAIPLPAGLSQRLLVLETSNFSRLAELVRRRRDEQSSKPSGRATYPFGSRWFLRTRLRRWRGRIPK
jgi:hypothetical protein